MSVKIQGMDELQSQLNLLTQDIASINNMALYDAAGAAKDAIASALQSLPVRDDSEYGTARHKLYGATQSEKQQIIANFGIAPFRKGEAGSQTSIGFTGYVNTKSRKFNNKVPTGMLMQCIEYGTQFRRGTHTISRAIKQIKMAAIQKAQERLDEEVKKIMNQ